MNATMRIKSGNYSHYDVIEIMTERDNSEKREFDILGRANKLELINAELLAALKEIAEMQFDDAGDWKVLVYGAKDTASAAIAKATGKVALSAAEYADLA